MSPDRHDDRRRSLRSVEAAAIAGLVYAVLNVISVVMLRSQPLASSSMAEIAEWYADTSNRRVVLTGLNLAAIGSIAFLWFVAVIRRRIGDREDRFFATVFLASGMLTVAIYLVAASVAAGPALAVEALDGAVPDRGDLSVMNGTARALYFVVLARIQAVFAISTSTVILRSGRMPRWLAYVGYAMALVMLLLPFVFEPMGLAFPIWVGAVSLTLLVIKRPTEDEASEP